VSTIVITGASSGVGRAAALALARDGHEVVVVGRNPERTREVAELAGGIPMTVDFDRIADVRRLGDDLAERFDRIDVLANNAGGMLRHRRRSADGVDQTWQHNVLAPFVLTTQLLPLLEESRARVIFTGSVAQSAAPVYPGNPNRDGLPWLAGWPAYGAAKRADIMIAAELARRTGLEAYSFHPGWIASRFAGLDRGPVAGIVARMAKSPEEGAAPLVHLATGDLAGIPNGTYFDGLDPDGRLSVQARDPGERAKLWDALTVQAQSIG
jgi:NAD(P)-dependent dehydrogenase (short-subunit alcohol dehydrogenase family)